MWVPIVAASTPQARVVDQGPDCGDQHELEWSQDEHAHDDQRVVCSGLTDPHRSRRDLSTRGEGSDERA